MSHLLMTSAYLLLLLALVMEATSFPTGHANPPEEAAWEAASSGWLERVAGRGKPRETGCGTRPWVCQEGRFFPPFGRKMCCNNRCVDVGSDSNNCGLCGVRCPFSWRCCNGMCVDPKTNPFHCGACNNRCALGSRCGYGMCGYAQQQHPLPYMPIPRVPCKHSPPLPPPHEYRHPRP